MPQFGMAQRIRAGEFWEGLGEGGLYFLSRATAAAPIDPYAGLMHVWERIWDPTKVWVAVFKVCMVMLNVITVLVSARACYHTTYQFEDWKMNEAGVSYCWTNATAKSMTNCIATDVHRLRQFQMMVVFETTIIVPVAVAFFAMNISFLCGCCQRCNELPERHLWFFCFAPGFIMGFSATIFLQLMIPARFRSLVVQAERKLWYYIIYYSILPIEDDFERYTAKGRHPKRVKTTRHKIFKWIRTVLVILLYIPLIAVSCQAILVKLLFLHFTLGENAIVWQKNGLPSTRWSRDQWLLFFGFLNQILASVGVNAVEMNCLLKYQFAGPDAKWQGKECFTLVVYLKQVARKVAQGKIRKKHGKIGAIAHLWSLEATDLQMLMQCPVRAERIENSSEIRADLWRGLWTTDEYRSYVQSLTDMKTDRKSGEYDDDEVLLRRRWHDLQFSEVRRLKKHRDRLLQQAGFVENHKTNEDEYCPRSMRFFLAGDVQNTIEDVESTIRETEHSDSESEHEVVSSWSTWSVSLSSQPSRSSQSGYVSFRGSV